MSEITYFGDKNKLTLYKNIKRLVCIDRITWSNFDEINNIVLKYCKKNNHKSALKNLAKEVFIEEAIDYDSYN